MSSLSSKQGPRYRHTAGEEETYETIGVEKLTPIIGAEISGVDLGAALSNRTMDEIHRALAENSVIFFRDQTITPQPTARTVRAEGSGTVCTKVWKPKSTPAFCTQLPSDNFA